MTNSMADWRAQFARIAERHAQDAIREQVLNSRDAAWDSRVERLLDWCATLTERKA